MLRTKKCWKMVKVITKMHNFEEFLKLDLNYEVVMSFLILGRKFIHIESPYFATAISTALIWLDTNKKMTPLELTAEYKGFFDNFTS
jgi:hypothetical protein